MTCILCTIRILNMVLIQCCCMCNELIIAHTRTQGGRYIRSQVTIENFSNKDSRFLCCRGCCRGLPTPFSSSSFVSHFALAQKSNGMQARASSVAVRRLDTSPSPWPNAENTTPTNIVSTITVNGVSFDFRSVRVSFRSFH